MQCVSEHALAKDNKEKEAETSRSPEKERGLSMYEYGAYPHTA